MFIFLDLPNSLLRIQRECLKGSHCQEESMAMGRKENGGGRGGGSF